MVYNVESTEKFKEALQADKLIVVDFYATWCGPCKVIAPKLVEFEKEFTNASFIKVDVDDLCDVAAEYSIRNMPTFLLIKNSEILETVVGANPQKLKEAIAKHA
ncbi:thioredoxin-like protein [Protomyces lactucae-debilis]|uniref:Thioredoxin n=1 Tax=Protomyces lactucae-debilis TaxID=2754530 RepID=A0A1Y2FP01_PROLT|nr:thioredoxin-like protein [Protomyces lactucae-debilis]ORY85711.1 thioredoxin-like protein [Protomyces lactucae-debilis]